MTIMVRKLAAAGGVAPVAAVVEAAAVAAEVVSLLFRSFPAFNSS